MEVAHNCACLLTLCDGDYKATGKPEDSKRQYVPRV
jgi:hypothetical protein